MSDVSNVHSLYGVVPTLNKVPQEKEHTDTTQDVRGSKRIQDRARIEVYVICF
jgi:hypothetical protein